MQKNLNKSIKKIEKDRKKSRIINQKDREKNKLFD